MKKYINPTIEVMHVKAMQAICQVSQGTQPGSAGHAPARKDVF